MLESAHLRNLILVANPTLYFAVLLAPSILAGKDQKRAYRLAADVVRLLDQAVAEGGWKGKRLEECGAALGELASTFELLKRHVRMVAGVILFWATLELSVGLSRSKGYQRRS